MTWHCHFDLIAGFWKGMIWNDDAIAHRFGDILKLFLMLGFGRLYKLIQVMTFD